MVLWKLGEWDICGNVDWDMEIVGFRLWKESDGDR